MLIAGSNAPANIKNSADVVCSGTADQTAVNNALSSAASTGDKTIWWGTLNLTAPINFTKSQSVLHGAGVGVSTLNMSSGFSGAAMLNCDGATATLKEVDVGYFTVQGNGLGTQGATDGVYFSAARSKLHDVNVYTVNGAGIHVKEHSVGTGDCYQSSVYRCWAAFCGNNGVKWEAGDSGIVDCQIFNNAGAGLYCAAPMDKIRGNYIWGNAVQSVAGGSTPGAGILVLTASTLIPISGNKIEQNSSGGLVFGTASLTGGNVMSVTGNGFAGNINTQTPGSGWFQSLPTAWFVQGSGSTSDIFLSSSSASSPSGITISGNFINPSQYSGTTGTSQYGIRIVTGQDVSVHNNVVFAGTSGRAITAALTRIDGLSGTTLSSDNVGV